VERAGAAPRRRIARRGAALAGALGFALGCASARVEEVPSAALYFSKGTKVLEGYAVLGLVRSVDYPKAVSLFQEVIDNYPFSEFAPLAELKIAGINESMGKFEEAASFYQDFVELHPNHPQVPFALYKLGESYIAQMRDPDRDQEATRKALTQLEFLVTRYPQSEFAQQGGGLLQRARDQLALREASIAEFYFSKGQYYAAVPRFQAALEQSKTYPGHCANRARLAVSLSKLGMAAEAQTVANELREVCRSEIQNEPIRPMLDQIEAAKN
jgi:outer membrane protein assembly factor BamD